VLLALQAVLVSTPSSPGQLTLCHSTPPVLLVKYINGKLHLARRQCQLERGRAFLQLQYLPVTKVLLLLHQSSAQNPQLCFDSSPVAVQWNDMPFYTNLARYELAGKHEEDDVHK